jgi:hypothetical protein
MKYAVEMGSGAMMHIPSLIKIGSGIQKWIWGIPIHKAYFNFFQNKKSRLIK